jgi:NADH-quinone oxidoreductase subunit C
MDMDELKAKIEADFKDDILSAGITPQKELIVGLKSEPYLAVCQKLHDIPEYGFQHLSCLTAVDYPKENKITIVNHLWSYQHAHQLTIKLDTARDYPKAPTVENIWKSANWFEREVFDLYGIIFEGHSDLRRIMMPDDYQKHPLRKDFSDDGFIIKPN